MPMATKNIPFDILYNIFLYWEETPSQSVVTLQLVSKFWREVALKCKQLWSRFNILITSLYEARFWSRQVPLRLEKSGPNSPIFFTLYLEYQTCDDNDCRRNRCRRPECSLTISQNVSEVLWAILGPNESLCARWAKVDITCGECSFPTDIPFFSYPTPNLVSIKLKNVYVLDHYPLLPEIEIMPFLPSVPSLQEIEVLSSDLPDLPDTSNATKIILRSDYSDIPRSWKATNSSGLKRADKVRYLELDITNIPDHPSHRDTLPPHLPFLECLSLSGRRVPMKMKEVQMPALKELRVCFDASTDPLSDITYDEELYKRPILDLLGCKGVPFSQIETIHIDLWNGYFKCMNDDKWDAYRRLLRVCDNVKRISSHTPSIVLILKLLEEECLDDTPIVDRAFVLSDGEVSREMRAGREEKLEDIRAMAVELGWSKLDEDKRRFFKKFRSIHYGGGPSWIHQPEEDEIRSLLPLDYFDWL